MVVGDLDVCVSHQPLDVSGRHTGLDQTREEGRPQAMKVNRSPRFIPEWETRTLTVPLEGVNRREVLIPRTQNTKRKEVLRDWYIAKAKEKILPRVRRQAKELGVEFGATKIVDPRYRWGSCTVKDNVNFNWRLIKAPMLVIDYVIAHELTHLIESNHTPRFWSIVRSQTATMEKAKNWLKENGQILEADI